MIHLTPREYEVMCMYESGKSRTEICQALFISRRTLENHRNTVARKVEAELNDPWQAMALFIKHKVQKNITVGRNNKVSEEIKARIFELREKGTTHKAIAERLGISFHSVYKVLKN